MSKEKEVVGKSLPKLNEKECSFVDKDGQLFLGTLKAQEEWSEYAIDNGTLSDTFKRPSEVMLGIQYAKSLNMEILPALKMMYVNNGSPCLFGDGPLILCRKSGLISHWREYYVDDDLKEICIENKNLKIQVFASVTESERLGEGGRQIDFFSVEDAEEAGLLEGTSKEFYRKYMKDMLRYKSRTRNVKSKFSDLLAGMEIAEWGMNSLPTRGYTTTKSSDDVVNEFKDSLKKNGNKEILETSK